ncbi:MAG: NADH-quinone oxidoreductase subunit A [Acidobacteriota bacterium]
MESYVTAPSPLWPFVVYCLVVLVTVVGMIAVSHILGERHHDRETDLPYEAGVTSAGNPRLRFSAKFYMIAMFFLIFDLEAVFIFSWAVALRETGWLGYVEVVVFIAVLVATLIYLWRVGARDWGPGPMRPLATGQTGKRERSES